MRQALGTAVFFGMLGVTSFGLLFTPVFYVLVRWIGSRTFGGTQLTRRGLAAVPQGPDRVYRFEATPQWAQRHR
jgi:hypothetical protein